MSMPTQDKDTGDWDHDAVAYTAEFLAGDGSFPDWMTQLSRFQCRDDYKYFWLSWVREQIVERGWECPSDMLPNSVFERWLRARMHEQEEEEEQRSQLALASLEKPISHDASASWRQRDHTCRLQPRYRLEPCDC